MAFSFLAVRALLGALVRSRRGLCVKDIELLVLRNELEILQKGANIGVGALEGGIGEDRRHGLWGAQLGFRPQIN